MMRSLAISLLLGIASCQSPTVSLKQGAYRGAATEVAVATGTVKVNKYLGIPYAASPVRFAPPEPAPTTTGEQDATQNSAVCFQQFSYPKPIHDFTKQVFNRPPPQESEDCLTVNVFTADGTTTGKTVMVWFYGGSLNFGGNAIRTYDGSSFAANQDIVLVVPNYRTNVFGFPGLVDGLPTDKRNLGFLDQRLLLQWVQDNVEQFGGDPSKVTIFGESAGSVSSDLLILTNPQNPPFRAAILQSGTAGLMATNPGSSASFDKLGAALNCTGDDVLSCVRAAPGEQIKDIIEKQSIAFGPVIDNSTIPSDLATARSEGRIANVPVLLGTTADEGRIFVTIYAGGKNEGNITQYLSMSYKDPAVLQQVLDAYPVGGDGPYPTDYEALSAYITDLQWTCPVARVANASATGGYPTWRFLFNATFPNTQAFPNGGAYHSSELPIIFGNFPGPPQPEPSDDQLHLSHAMQTIWANFAKNPTQGPGWDAVHAGNEHAVGVLGGPLNRTGVATISSDLTDFRCAVLARAATGSTGGSDGGSSDGGSETSAVPKPPGSTGAAAAVRVPGADRSGVALVTVAVLAAAIGFAI